MRYLTEADHDEAMTVFYGPDKEPHTHTVWTGDFMGLCKHDIACPACFDDHAVISRNVTPGHYQQYVNPCRKCQEDGWRTVKLSPLVLWVLIKLKVLKK